MRSPFDLNNPPPETAPGGVICPGLWTVQVRWWKRHTPLAGEKVCTECGQSWPCHSWLCWDGQIGDAVEASVRSGKSVLTWVDAGPTATVRNIAAGRRSRAATAAATRVTVRAAGETGTAPPGPSAGSARSRAAA